MQLMIDPTGTLRCVYDELIELAAIGSLVISRASHVEPDQHGQWLADLAPVGGPRLGPYANRSQALESEQQWLVEHWLGTDTHATG